MANGDLANCNVEDASSSFVSGWQYIQNDGVRLNPARTLPVISGTLSFEALIHAVAAVAAVRATKPIEVDNPVGTELVSKAAQVSVLANLGLSATVTVHGR